MLNNKTYYNLSIQDTLASLKTSTKGLNGTTVAARQKQYGTNELKSQKPESLAHKFLMQFKNLMVIVLLISAAISITLALVNHEYSDLFEGGVILFIVFLNATIGVIQEKKAENAIKSLNSKMEPYSKVVRDGKTIILKSKDIVPGDIVLLEAGDIIPADLRLIETHSLKCNESALTGESKLVQKNEHLVLSNDQLVSDLKNMAFSGCSVAYGRGVGVVCHIGENTEIGKIAKMLDTHKPAKTPLEKSIDKIGKFTSISVLIIAAIIFVIEMFFIKASGVLNAFMVSVALAVAAIPESLPAVITIIMALGVVRLARQNAIVKKLSAVETLGSCNVICSDKTGTITKNKLTVQSVYVDGTTSFNKNCDDYKLLLKAIALCNNASPDAKSYGNHTDIALMEYCLNSAIDYTKLRQNNIRVNEVPFDSSRKIMSTINRVNDKNMAFVKGATDVILNLCNTIIINGHKVEFTPNLKEQVSKQNYVYGSQQLRVIAVAYKDTLNDTVESCLTFIGLVAMADPPREEVYDAIKKCFKAGLKPIMITGDHKETAFSIAREVGIAKTKQEVLTGAEINKMTDKQLSDVIDNYTVFARVAPLHKVRIVKAFQKHGKIVAMTGDGVNDAPSIKCADIGVGMGKSGTDVTKMVSDLILSDDNFATIVMAVEEGRKVYANITKAVQFLLSTNAVEVISILIAILVLPQSTFLFPCQILFINLVTDSLPAFALGMEPAEKDIMDKPPRKGSNILAGEVGWAIIYQSFIQILITVFVFVIGYHMFGNFVASTMAFYVIIYMQWLHSINVKTNKSIFSINPFKNKTFNICFVITLLLNLSVSVVPFMLRLFSLAALNLTQWLIVFIASFMILPLVEIIKLSYHLTAKVYNKTHKANLRNKKRA